MIWSLCWKLNTGRSFLRIVFASMWNGFLFFSKPREVEIQQIEPHRTARENIAIKRKSEKKGQIRNKKARSEVARKVSSHTQKSFGLEKIKVSAITPFDINGDVQTNEKLKDSRTIIREIDHITSQSGRNKELKLKKVFFKIQRSLI